MTSERTETVLTVFSAAIDEADGEHVIEVPDREVELGALDVGETYRVAVMTGGETDRRPQRSGRSGSDADADPPVVEGERREFEIEDIGDQGDGIARVGPGYIVFVPDTKVGDRVTVEITQVLDNFAFAEVVEGEPVTG